MKEDLHLASRTGLPDALRVLLDAFPREGWSGHENFGEMVQFWLRRHLMFREVIEKLQQDTQARLDAAMAPETYAARVGRLGNFFLHELHMHHTIEDQHYFPKLVSLDARLQRGFDMLEADHSEIDVWLGRFADTANSVLSAGDDAIGHEKAGALWENLAQMATLLDRHLVDEEELIVPVILRSGFEG